MGSHRRAGTPQTTAQSGRDYGGRICDLPERRLLADTALKIAIRFVAPNPGSSHVNRDLSVCTDGIGQVATAAGDL